MCKLFSLSVGVAAVALALATPTLAGKPSGVAVPIPDDHVRLDLCAFPVDFDYLQWDRRITTHETGAGTLMMIETGVAKVRLANLDNGASLDLNISGPGKLRVSSDGSSVLTGTGPWLFSSVPPGLGLPPLFLTSGHFEVHIDSGGNFVSFERVGHLVDLCAELAG